jgi:organic hydroperoxide reductase OsmC/OhrA
MHTFEAAITWTGNTGNGTATWKDYERDHLIRVAGKPDLAGSASPIYRGAAERYNPEDLFVASVAACHMLFFLSRCARAGVRVTAYEDRACGTIGNDADGGGRFTHILLRPVATVAAGDMVEIALSQHEEAHRLCFIANSCSAPIHVEPRILVEAGVS